MTSAGWQRGEAPVTHPGEAAPAPPTLELLLEPSLKGSEFPGARRVPLRCCCNVGKIPFSLKDTREGKTSRGLAQPLDGGGFVGVPGSLSTFLSLLAPIQMPKESDENLTVFLGKIPAQFVIWKQTRRALLGITEIVMPQAQRSKTLERERVRKGKEGRT